MKKSPSKGQVEIDRLKQIEFMISTGKLHEAARELNALVEIQRNDPRLFLLGSLLAQAARNDSGTLLAASKAHSLAPLWPVASIRLAEVHGMQGSSREALEYATLAVKQTMTDGAFALDTPEILQRAIMIAQGLGMHKIALQWLSVLQEIDPSDINVQFRVGMALLETADFATARLVFDRMLAQRPHDAALLRGRLRALLGSGEQSLAIEDARMLIALEPDSSINLFYAELAQGKTPATQPAAMIEGLFNDYAARYDKHLVVDMKYQLPNEVAQAILQWHPDRKSDILDLGCGTGLLGACLGPIEGVLVGVDLSKDMLEQASKHGVYDRFHVVNVLDALQATPADLYHVIVALEVLIYVGSLDSVIPNAFRVLLPGGRFVFSCEYFPENERLSEKHYALQNTFRFTHQLSYVEKLLNLAGFVEIEVRDLCIRYEAGKPVTGFLVVAKKPIKSNGKIARKSPRNAKPVNLQQ